MAVVSLAFESVTTSLVTVVSPFSGVTSSKTKIMSSRSTLFLWHKRYSSSRSPLTTSLEQPSNNDKHSHVNNPRPATL
ncbi:MAG: hypothetical protein ACI8XX_000086 [Polaribacter sp.]|jgi:hypothetical protein